MRLFNLDENYDVQIDPEVFLIEDFKKLRDSRKNPELILKEISFLFFFCDLRSEFTYNQNLQERKNEIIKRINLPENYTLDDLMKNAIKTYKELALTPAAKLLQTSYIVLDNIDNQLKTIDITKVNKNGIPIWNIKQVMDTLKAIPEVVQAIKQAEEEFLKEEETASAQMKGNRIKSLYEDGFHNL